MSVEAARLDIVNDAFVLVPNEARQAVVPVRIVKDRGIGGSAGIDEPPASIDQSLQKMSPGTAVLSLDQERESGVGDRRG
jgi:hypothetical protein